MQSEKKSGEREREGVKRKRKYERDEKVRRGMQRKNKES